MVTKAKEKQNNLIYIEALAFNPGHAEPGYALPLQTV